MSSGELDARNVARVRVDTAEVPASLARVRIVIGEKPAAVLLGEDAGETPVGLRQHTDVEDVDDEKISRLGMSPVGAEFEQEDELGVIEQELENGQTPLWSDPESNAAAIYAYVPAGTCSGKSYPEMFWPRPCSGVVLRRDGGRKVIMTARHCVTKDGKINGPLISNVTHLRVTGRKSPGNLTVSESSTSFVTTESPDPEWLYGAVIKAGTPSSSLDHAEDYAFVEVYGPLYTYRTYEEIGLLMPYTNVYAYVNGKDAVAWGYGRNDQGSCSDHNASGAGTLRYGIGFDISDAKTNGTLTHASSNGSKVKLAHGDSGGPLMLYPNGKMVLVGVNSTTTTATGSHRLVELVQSWQGHVYLASMSTSNQVFGAWTGFPYPRVDFEEDSSRTQVYWDGARIKLGSHCLTDSSSDGGLVTLASCSSSNLAQKWKMYAGFNVIYSAKSGRCLKKSGDYIASSKCDFSASATDYQWRFLADNEVE